LSWCTHIKFALVTSNRKNVIQDKSPTCWKGNAGSDNIPLFDMYSKFPFYFMLTEAQLAEDVLEMLLSCTDEPIKQELKFLHTSLREKPQIINLGNYINVDKKLMVKMGFSVVVVLIALMQFNSCPKI
ncbi:unnamed protein product, partial [Allacma fusca]